MADSRDVTVNFHHEHCIVPTICPWVSEDGLKQANGHGNCVALVSEKIGEGAPTPIFFEGSGKKSCSLYRGISYIKVRYIEIPLH